MCVDRETLIFSFVIGLVITLATALLVNGIVIGEFPNIRFVSIPMVGVTYYGFPLPWMKQVVYPGAIREIIPLHLVLNVAYWIGLVLIVKVLYLRKVRVKERLVKRMKAVGRLRPRKKPKRPAREAKPKRKRVGASRRSGSSRRARSSRRR